MEQAAVDITCLSVICRLDTDTNARRVCRMNVPDKALPDNAIRNTKYRLRRIAWEGGSDSFVREGSSEYFS